MRWRFWLLNAAGVTAGWVAQNSVSRPDGWWGLLALVLAYAGLVALLAPLVLRLEATPDASHPLSIHH